MDIKEVLHLYIGCKIRVHKDFIPNTGNKECATDDPGVCWLTPNLLADLLNGTFLGTIGIEWKPILRRLGSITINEALEVSKVRLYDMEEDVQGTFDYYRKDPILFLPEEVLLLLKKGFDLFGLIESGQAIDESTLNQKPNKSN